MEITKGQRLSLLQITQNLTFHLGLNISGTEAVVDFACFGLDAEQKLSDDAYMTFFNQAKTPCGAIELSIPAGDSSGFFCQLNLLPVKIDRLVFTAAIDGVETMQQIKSGYLRFLVSGQETGRFSFSGTDFQDEKALMLGELYRKDGNWRFAAIGQGFNGGLKALVNHFGGVVEEKPLTSPSQTPAKVSLAKITLEKSGDKISLAKQSDAQGHGRIICNLNWTKQKKSFLGLSKGVDLDLGCLYELTDGSKSVIQALGNMFGYFQSPPYIHLAGDDRTGDSIDGEFLFINGDHLKDIKRICIFAFIYQGVANWQQADAVVTITVPGHPVIEVRLDEYKNKGNMCAIAMLENNQGELKLTKLVEYFKGHRDLDSHFDWGLKWVRGHK